MMFFPLPFPLNTINNILEMHNIVVTPWVRRTEQKGLNEIKECLSRIASTHLLTEFKRTPSTIAFSSRSKQENRFHLEVLVFHHLC